MLDDWTTARWIRGAGAALDRRVREPDFASGVLAWFLMLAAAIAGLGAVVDFVLVAREGALRHAFVVAATAAALGCFAALLALPAFVIVAEVANAIGARASRVRHLWPLPLALAAPLVPSLVLDRFMVGRMSFWTVVSATGLVLFVLGLCGYAAWRGRARLVAGLIGAAAVTLDTSTPRPMYRDLHDLAAFVAVVAALVVLSPLRHRLARVRPGRLAGRAVAVLVAAAVATVSADHAAPGWRTRAWRIAHWEPREARLFRRLVDLDGDGFSPVAWGGDCDDLDASRNPLARETTPGRDKNCNGFTLPVQSSDDDRGLLTPVGAPDLPPDTADLALLITVDCWSRETFRPDVMPRLSEYATRGVRFSRLYAAGSRTHVTLPLLMRPSERAMPLTARLAAAGVPATAVLGYHDRQMGDIVAGFELLNPQTYEAPFHPELGPRPAFRSIDADADATALTNRAIEDLRAHAGKRHLLWVHYFDAHWPYRPRDARDRVAAPVGWPPDYAQYLAQLHHIDGEIGRLLDELDESGQLGRSVVVITSDHGEGFGRHHVAFHGVSAYEMLVHVPGLLLAPGLLPGTYDGLVSHRDLPATLAGAFGLVRGDGELERFGRSWLRLRDARDEPLHRFVVTRSSGAVDVTGFVRPEAAIIEGPMKLVVTFEDALTEAYDLVSDPDELHDLGGRSSMGALRRDLELYRDIDGYP